MLQGLFAVAMVRAQMVSKQHVHVTLDGLALYAVATMVARRQRLVCMVIASRTELVYAMTTMRWGIGMVRSVLSVQQIISPKQRFVRSTATQQRRATAMHCLVS